MPIDLLRQFESAFDLDLTPLPGQKKSIAAEEPEEEEDDVPLVEKDKLKEDPDLAKYDSEGKVVGERGANNALLQVLSNGKYGSANRFGCSQNCR